MSEKISIILIFLLLQFHLKAQDYRDFDSLQTELKMFRVSKMELGINSISQRDTTEVKILFEISKSLWYNNLQEGISYANEALELSRKIGYKHGILDSYFSLSTLYLNKGIDSLTFVYCNESLIVAQELNDKLRIADTYANLGFLYYLRGNAEKAQEMCHMSIKIAEANNFQKTLALAYTNLGSVNFMQENDSEALKYYKLALELSKRINYKLEIAANYHNLAIVLTQYGQREKVIPYLLEAKRVNHEIGNRLWEAYNCDVIGVEYHLLGDNEKGLQYSLISADILNDLGEKVKLSTTLNNIGTMYFALKDYRNARKYFNEAKRLSSEANFLGGMADSHETLSTLDSALGNWNSAYFNYRQFIYYRDSLINLENIKTTIHASLQYDYDKKQILDSLEFVQQKQIALIELQKQRKYTYVGIFGVAITALLLFFVYRNYRKQQIANRMLKEAQEQLIRSEKLAAFGVMASRVAHEIQNPLNFVNNFSDITKEIVVELVNANTEDDKKETAEVLIGNLNRINEHGKRAASIVKQLQEHTLKGTAHEFFESDGK